MSSRASVKGCRAVCCRTVFESPVAGDISGGRFFFCNGDEDMAFQLLTFFLFIFFTSDAYADCHLISKNQMRREGTIVYNKDYDVLQACVGGRWRALGKIASDPNPPCGPNKEPGCLHTDNTIYAGLSPDGNRPMFTTRCATGKNWSGATCDGVEIKLPFNFGNGSNRAIFGPNSPFDGAANTQALVSLDADTVMPGFQDFLAARYCSDLHIHGHNDWYLPAILELAVLYHYKSDIRGFRPVIYYSSTAYGAAPGNMMIIFQGNNETAKPNEPQYERSFRCVRKDVD